MLCFCEVSDPLKLWTNFRDFFSEDFLHQEIIRNQESEAVYTPFVYNCALVHIEECVFAFSRQCITSFGLPKPHRQTALATELQNETSYDKAALSEFLEDNVSKLLPDQLKVYTAVIDNVTSKRGGIFFLDAPGGTGKTFVVKILLAKIRCTHKIALAVASSGIAATLLPGGRTAHSALKLPFNLFCDEADVCNINKNSQLADVLRCCELIVWDEATMSHKKAFEAVNKTLKDLRNSEELMGGITLLL